MLRGSRPEIRALSGVEELRGTTCWDPLSPCWPVNMAVSSSMAAERRTMNGAQRNLLLCDQSRAVQGSGFGGGNGVGP